MSQFETILISSDAFLQKSSAFLYDDFEKQKSSYLSFCANFFKIDEPISPNPIIPTLIIERL